MAEPPSPVHGAAAAAAAAVSEKEPFGKLQPPFRDPPGPLSAKKVRTEEKKAPRRLNGEGGSGGNSRQLQPLAAPSPQSYGSPTSWSFPGLSAAPSPSSARSSFSFSAGSAVPSSASASSSQPVPRKLLVPPTLLHAQPHHLLLPAAASSANAKPRRPKEKREKERRRHGLGGAGEAGGAAREENGEVKPLSRGGCRRWEGEGRAPRVPATSSRPRGPGRGSAGAAGASLKGAGGVPFSAGDFAVPLGTGNGACNFGCSEGNAETLIFYVVSTSQLMRCKISSIRSRVPA